MKKGLLKEELDRMKKLAGLVNENSFNLEQEVEIEPHIEESNITETQDVMVADMREEAHGLMSEITDSLEFASAKLYDLKKMSDYIIREYPELSKQISDTVEPMMEAFERIYPMQFKELLKKFY